MRIVLIALAGLLALPIAQTASPAAAKPRRGTVTRSFANLTAIELPVSSDNPTSALNLYPSPVEVRGLKHAKIRDVNVRLNNLSHRFPDDVQVLLVGPRGRTAIVMASTGGSFIIDDATLTFDDEASAGLPDEQMIESGTFRPTNTGNLAVTFNAPAPATGGNAALSVFDGDNPNGTWRRYVQDELGAIDGGVIAGGWEIEIEARVKHKRDKKR